MSTGQLTETITEPTIAPLLEQLQAAIGADPASTVAQAAAALIRALDIRTFRPEPETDDRGEQVVVTAYGVDLSIRRRDDGLFVHIDSSSASEDMLPLIAEVDNAGANVYGEVLAEHYFDR